jgi:hypothetical protein
MKRLLFRLSMPSVGSWNGKWTGSDRNYTICKQVTDKKALELDGESFYYRWNDGWTAKISVTVIKKGETLKKSDGFCGYDWMVENIWLYGDIKGEKEEKEKVNAT